MRPKILLIILAALLILMAISMVVYTCSTTYQYHDQTDSASALPDNPTPGDLVQQIMKEDSLNEFRKEEVYKAMSGMINGYRNKVRSNYLTGYFVTDLDKDGLPELWIKTGTNGENSKLELFYPMPDGTLKKSVTNSGAGKFYRGKDYLMQTVSAGPGYVNVNRITIRRGEMQVETEKSIDLYSNSDSKIPKFEEPEIRDVPFGNLSPLQQYFK